MGNNHLGGAIPSATLGNLKELEVLNIQSCGLTRAFPHEFTELTALTSLRMAQNSFEGEPPESIGKLTNLTYLVAAKAGLSGMLPPQLGDCDQLKVLDLSFNSFLGPLPSCGAEINRVASPEIQTGYRVPSLCGFPTGQA